MLGWQEFWIKRARRKRRWDALEKVAAFPRHHGVPKHGLDGELVVSLTSYPPRFPALAKTLKSLLDQTVRPDRTVLWIAYGDLALLPMEVRKLEAFGLTIRSCDDLGSFKKIGPALAAFPDAFVLIADDDSYYPDDWLATIAAAFDPGRPSIVCGRAHRLVRQTDGLAPYGEWDREVDDPASNEPSRDLLPTGNGGVLYPPGALAGSVLDEALRQRLSPTCDDLWLFFNARRQGTPVRRAPGARPPLVEWGKTQQVSLRKFHRGGRKDAIIAALSGYFGAP